MRELSNKEIVHLIQSGIPKEEEVVFRYFYRSYYGIIENLILNNSGNISDVPDIFQDSILVFYHSVKKNKFQANSTVKTYFYSICNNLWKKELKQKKREVTFSKLEIEPIQLDDSIFETLESTEKRNLIIQLLEGIGKQCQELLEAFYFRKMKIKDIQLLLNYSSEQVLKNKKGKCMKTLREKVVSNQEYQEILRS